MANTSTVGGFKFRGKVNAAKAHRALSIIKSNGGKLRKDAKCVIVHFGANNPVQRCEGRRLKAHNKRQCRNKKKLFVKCAGRKRR